MASPTLPFSEFLDALRDKGFGVGLHEYVALGRLLEAWGSTDRDEIRNGIAALIARHDDDIRAIKKLFDEFYPREVVVRDDGKTGAPVRRFTFVRLVKSARLWAAGLGVIALAVGAVSLVRWTKTIELPVTRSPFIAQTLPPIEPPPPAGLLPPFDPPTLEPPASAIPPPAPRTMWSGIAALSGGALILTAGALWGTRLRAGARKWTARAWQSALAALPGPYHGTLVLKDYVSRLPRADIEDTATVLGRSFAGDVRGTELDVLESLRRTLRSGLQPHLVFRPRRVQETIVTLVDVSLSMAIFARKIESFRADLRRQGVALETWFFDAEISAVARQPHGPTTPLEGFLRLHGEGPVMILSAGAGVPVTVARKNDQTLTVLQKRTRLVWITPIADPQLWPEALQRLSIPIVSMTRSGLLRAAQILAYDDGGNVMSFARASVSRPVTERHVEELRRLASLVPYPTPELLELLRQRFAPDIPESAVLYAVDTRAASANVPFRMSDDDIRDLLKKVRAETPEREAAVRAYLVQVLEDSEPAPGSAAHLRWQASMAIHDGQIAELQGADASTAIAELRELYHGPLWDEVRGMVERLAPAGAVTNEMRATVHVKATAPPDFRASTASTATVAKPHWSGPGWRVIATSTAVALAVAAIGYVAGPFRVQAKVARSYTLTYAPALVAGNPGRLVVRAVPRADAPQTVQIFRDGAAWGAPITLAPDSATVSLDDGPAHLYDARSSGAREALAVSNRVWAPSILVIIDAHPWASVTVDWEDRPASQSARTLYRDEITPFAVRLPEGQYSLSFVNGPSTLAQSVTVSSAGDRSFSYMMPGLSPDDVLSKLGLPGKTSAKK